MKGLVKNQPVFRGFDKAACQRVIEFRPVADIDGLAGLDAVKRGRRPDAKPGAPEHPHEMRDVLVQLLAPHRPRDRPRNRPPCGTKQRRDIIGLRGCHPALNPFMSVCTSVRIRAASLPLMRAMSS